MYEMQELTHAEPVALVAWFWSVVQHPPRAGLLDYASGRRKPAAPGVLGALVAAGQAATSAELVTALRVDITNRIGCNVTTLRPVAASPTLLAVGFDARMLPLPAPTVRLKTAPQVVYYDPVIVLALWRSGLEARALIDTLGGICGAMLLLPQQPGAAPRLIQSLRALAARAQAPRCFPTATDAALYQRAVAANIELCYS